MNLRQRIIKDLGTLKNNPFVNKNILNQFEVRVQSGKLIKPENYTDHLCCFFLPIHIPTQSMYLVHHKKADDWIPPGGHIDQGELPIETVKREFQEELTFKLTDEKIQFFNISMKHINNPRNTCKIHYDLWFIVKCKEKHPFAYLQKEFYSANWFKISDNENKSRNPHINEMLGKIKSQFFPDSP